MRGACSGLCQCKGASMARVEWVKIRLQNWAMWKERESRGGLGFAKQSSFLNEAAQGGYRESIIPVDDIDAALTNSAVESMRAGRFHLYETLQAYYVKGWGEKESARRMSVAESTIRARLDEADRALVLWFSEYQERQRSRMQASA
jgi:hypothetical protein